MLIRILHYFLNKSNNIIIITETNMFIGHLFELKF